MCRMPPPDQTRGTAVRPRGEGHTCASPSKQPGRHCVARQRAVGIRPRVTRPRPVERKRNTQHDMDAPTLCRLPTVSCATIAHAINTTTTTTIAASTATPVYPFLVLGRWVAAEVAAPSRVTSVFGPGHSGHPRHSPRSPPRPLSDSLLGVLARVATGPDSISPACIAGDAGRGQGV